MQTTKLDPSLSNTLTAAREPGLTLIIGNKNYSSWSMRPWVAMTAFGIPFQEVRVLLDPVSYTHLTLPTIYSV